jgi:pilus assembly protein FimV
MACSTARPQAFKTGVAVALCAMLLAAASTRAQDAASAPVPSTAGPIAVAVTAGQAVPAAGPATHSSADAAIEATVRAWAQAWSAKNLERYLGFYAAAFKPSDGQTRAAWEKLRRARVSGPRSIEVSISDLKVVRHDDARAAVSFHQRYRSDRYRDETDKTLELVREGDRWQIVEERVGSAAAKAAAAPARAAAPRMYASLGNLRVLSALGQPLRVEIEIGALRRGEQDGLSVGLASPEDYRLAGIHFNPVLIGAKTSIEKRDGKPIIAVTTRNSVKEPFLRMLVELTSKSGRLVREYTVLLDPPTYVPPANIVVVIGPRPAAGAAPQRATPPAPRAAPSAPPAPAPMAPPSTATTTGTYQVVAGDTLAGIAERHRHAEVTVDQELVALYRANPEAFANGNINLLLAGATLKIPERAAVAAIDPVEATDAARKLMSGSTEQRGRIAAKAPTAVSAKGKPAEAPSPGAAPAPGKPKGQVKLSRVEPSKPAATSTTAAQEDDRIAHERALAELQSRARELEKTVADLRRLIEIKNQQIAELERRAAAPPPAPTAAPVVKPAIEPPKPPVLAAKPAVEAPKPAVEAPKPAVEAPKPAPPPVKPKPAPTPKPAPKPRPVPPPPAPEPGLLDEYLGDPLMLGGLGVVGILLVAYGAYAWRKKKRAARSQLTDQLREAAVAGASALDASAAVAAQQATATEDAREEVDPVAEADVYIAYGRDAQAEQILHDAMQKGENRPIAYMKLLQIYAKRHDTERFEATALKMRGLVAGEGPDWDKAMALGRSIDPGNGLYGQGEADEVTPAVNMSEEPEVDFDLDAVMGSGETQTAETGTTAPPEIDFRIDTTSSGTERPAEADMTLDFDLGGATSEQPPVAAESVAPPAEAEAAPERGGIDFDLGGTTAEKPAVAESAPPAEIPSPERDRGLDAGLSLEPVGEQPAAPAEKAEPAPPVDEFLSTINLDLGETASTASGAGASDAQLQEVATKIHLAKAYHEIGDSDGARELLNEVIAEGNAAQQAEARQMLAGLE